MCRDGRRGERGDGSICVVLMRGRARQKESEGKRGRGCQPVFVSFITQQQFCFRGSFEAHSLSHLVWGLPAVFVRACVVCIFINVCECRLYSKRGGV